MAQKAENRRNDWIDAVATNDQFVDSKYLFNITLTCCSLLKWLDNA